MDLRHNVTAKISLQEYSYIQLVTPSKLLTNLTSDIDAIKTFVSQAIASIIFSIFLIIGASTRLKCSFTVSAQASQAQASLAIFFLRE